MADSDLTEGPRGAEALNLMLAPQVLAGETILVTGGGSGLGRIMAQAFVMLGARVHICGRRGNVLEETVAALGAIGPGTITSHVCDIRDDAGVDAMLDRIWADAPLTGLVNNAAGNFLSRSEDLSLKGFDAIANIVFRGTFALTHNCSRRWLDEGRRASVLSILATWVWNGSAFTVPSAMAKSGIKTMTQSLAVEWGGRGIRLNAIAPGPFPTEGVRARLRPGMSEDDAFANARHDNPMGRVGRPSELANLATFLMSPGAEFINGEIIAIDGAGWLAGGGNFAHLRHWGDAEWAEARSNIRAADAADRSARG